MNEITVFSFNGAQVRTLEIEGEPWWVLRDVCEVLDLQAPHMVAGRLEDDERSQASVIDSLGRAQDTTIINESGLYAVILRSDKPEAKAFRKWITSEVLPSLRRKGSYTIPGAPDRQPLMPEYERARAAALIAIEALNPAPSARITILRGAYKAAGLPTDCLPSYVDEGFTRSLTELLKLHGIQRGAAEINLLLEQAGVLEHRSRPSTKGAPARFWALSHAGSLYGKNIINEKQPRETQPHYYPGRFLDLMRLVGIKVAEEVTA